MKDHERARNSKPATARLLVADRWRSDDHEHLGRVLHDPKTDHPVLLRWMGRLVKDVGAQDGDEIEVSVRLLACRPFGERHIRFAPDTGDMREPELPPLETARRRACRELGVPIAWETGVEISLGDPPNLVRLWQEDDASRAAGDESRMHLADAFLKFGLDAPAVEALGPRLARLDNGDHGYDLYRDGWVRGWGFDGDSLHRTYRRTDGDGRPAELPVWAEVFEPRGERDEGWDVVNDTVNVDPIVPPSGEPLPPEAVAALAAGFNDEPVCVRCGATAGMHAWAPYNDHRYNDDPGSIVVWQHDLKDCERSYWDGYLGDYANGDGVCFTIQHMPNCHRRGQFRVRIDIAPQNEVAWGCFDEQDQPLRYFHDPKSLIAEIDALARVLWTDRVAFSKRHPDDAPEPVSPPVPTDAHAKIEALFKLGDVELRNIGTDVVTIDFLPRRGPHHSLPSPEPRQKGTGPTIYAAIKALTPIGD